MQSAGDRIFFDTDRNNLTSQAITTLDRQSAWLQQYPQVNVWVAGNCDESATEEYDSRSGSAGPTTTGTIRRRTESPQPDRDDQLRQVAAHRPGSTTGSGSEPERDHIRSITRIICYR